MRVLVLGDANSSHIIKWTESLAKKNIEIYLFSLSKINTNIWQYSKEIHLIDQQNFNLLTKQPNGDIRKLRYLKVLWRLKKIIGEVKPDIVHAHYATSYGLLGALTRFHPYILSVWGSDVFEFPRKSIMHKFILKYNLKSADKILSTSYAMKEETSQYVDKIEVLPFGINLERFKNEKAEPAFSKDSIVIGTIKGLDKKYGIEYLIKAFSILKNKYNHLDLRLVLVGDGPLKEELSKLSKKLGVDEHTYFWGNISYAEIVKYHNLLDVYVALSESESFGVAVIEASACEKPVVVSDAGGLPEVVEDGVTGFVVPRQNPASAAMVMEKLILDENLRKRMGKAGRNRVRKLFNWEDNVNEMVKIYKELLQK